MSKVASIDRRKLPRDLAEWILANEKQIKSAILTVTMNDKDSTTHNLFAGATNNDLAFAAVTLLTCFVTDVKTQEGNEI